MQIGGPWRQQGPLRRWRLVELEPGSPLAFTSIRTEERILHHLLGIEGMDFRLESIITLHSPPALVAEAHMETAAAIAADWEPAVRGWPAIQLVGDDPDGQEDVAALIAAELGWSLGMVHAADLPAAPHDRHLFAALWTRESVLGGRVLLIVADAGPEGVVSPVVDALTAPTIVASRDGVPLRRPSRTHRIDLPRELARRQLWRAALDASGVDDPRLDGVAGRFPRARERSPRSPRSSTKSSSAERTQCAR